MTYYLYDNPNPNAPVRDNGIRGWFYPQRTQPLRLIVVHTPETLTDYDGPDTAAEAVANYFATATRPVSAHACIDRDSTIECLPDEAVGFHVRGHNSVSVGAEIGYTYKQWGKNPVADDLILDRTARWAAARCHRWGIPARRLTLADVEAGAAGLVAHSDLDPTRRLDPGNTFPWQTLIDLIGGYLMAWTRPGDPVTTLEDADAVFAYQGSVADSKAATYNPTTIAETNDRLWLAVARLTDLAMVHDRRMTEDATTAASNLGFHRSDPTAHPHGPHDNANHTHNLYGTAT